MRTVIASRFGADFAEVKARINSYELIENFIIDLGKYYPGKTEEHVSDLRQVFREFNNQQFAFLVCHTGYIPEEYSHDSSEETLFSKLVELVVQEWAVRIGFAKSCLPSQKSSKEDVTILDEDHVIVCDAKSFRLGRSQPAPNVKDVLKHADIAKWLSAHQNRTHVGGLVAFPRHLDWKGGSDFYQYTTDKTLPTICLHYEHMSFLSLLGDGKDRLLTNFAQYPDIFPVKRLKNERNRDFYYQTLEATLFKGAESEWNEFRLAAYAVSNERVFHTYKNLVNSIKKTKDDIANEFDRINDIDLLRRRLVQSESQRLTENLDKQVKRIMDFREMSDGYYQ